MRLQGTLKSCHWRGSLQREQAHPLHVQVQLMAGIHDFNAGQLFCDQVIRQSILPLRASAGTVGRCESDYAYSRQAFVLANPIRLVTS
jgi:hypothetical protein